MPSQFQPYYPHPFQQAVAQKAATAASGGKQDAGLPIDKLMQAIQQQKAANALANDPDPDWLYTDPNAQPAAVAASPASYY